MGSKKKVDTRNASYLQGWKTVRIPKSIGNTPVHNRHMPNTVSRSKEKLGKNFSYYENMKESVE